MFGMYGASFGQGMLEQGEAMDRSRRELASAFETFKRNNPYATYQDYQAFVDMYAGNNNYLRGGIPGDEVIQALAAQGAERRQRDLMAENLKEARSRAELMGSLEALVDRSLMGMSGDDYDKAFNDFTQSFGGPNAFPGMNVRSMFSPERRERLQSVEARKYIDDAVRLASQANGEIDPDIISKTFGVNPDIAKRVSDNAKRVYAEQKQKEAVEYGAKTLKDMAENPQLGDSYLNNYGRYLTDEQKAKFKTDLEGMREKIKKQEDELKEQKRVDARNRLETAIQGNGDFRAMLMSVPDRQSGVAALRQFMQGRLTTSEAQSMNDDDIAQMYDVIVSGINLSRKNELEKRDQEISKNAAELKLKMAEASEQEAGRRFSDDSLYSKAQQAAVRSIARSYNLNDARTADAVKRVIEEKGRSASADEIITAVQSDKLFAMSAKSIDKTYSQYEEQLRIREGIHDGKQKTFSQWFRESDADLQSEMKKAHDEFASLIAKETDPARKAEMARMWKINYTDALNTMKDRVEARGSNQKWMASGEGWQEERAAELLNKISMYKQHFDSLADQSIAASAAAPGTPRQFQAFKPTTAAQPLPGSQNATPAGRAIGPVLDEAKVWLDIRERIARPYLRQNTVLGQFRPQTPQQVADSKLVENFISSNGIVTYFANYPEELEKFRADPVGYARSRTPK